MIASQDRSGWIGASDVQFVIGNWKTKTWEKWWMEKLGISRGRFDNKYTLAGTNWEHRILDSLGLPDLEKDRCFLIEDLRLRVNLDGNTPSRIVEVKTFQWAMGWKVPKKYINQVQVQMFGSKIFEAEVVAYGLEEADYDNYLRPVDHRRLSRFPILYNPQWIETVYLPKHMILAEALKRGVFPYV